MSVEVTKEMEDTIKGLLYNVNLNLLSLDEYYGNAPTYETLTKAWTAFLEKITQTE